MTVTLSGTSMLQVSGLEVHYTENGSGSPLLFLHGYDGPLRESQFLERLAQRYRVVAPIQPGFASTSSRTELQDIRNLALLYLELIDKLNIDQLDIVGHSLGGMLAAELATLAPDRIGHLVLISPFGLWVDEHPVPDLLSAGGSYLAKLVWNNPELDASHQETTTAIERTMNVAVASNYLWPLPDRGLQARMYRLRIPVLLVRGSADSVISEGNLATWQSSIAKSTLRTIASAGHFPMIENEDETTEAVVTFLS